MLKCKMCYLWQNREDKDELSVREWESVIEAISNLGGSDQIQIHFGGGEPFFKKELLSLVKSGSQKGFTTRVTSNGFLVDKEVASRIIDSGLGQISFSLDSLEESIHDGIRGVSGTFRKVMGAIDLLSGNKIEGGPVIGVNCLISALNLESVIPVAKWVLDNKRLSGVIFQAVIQPHNTLPNDLWYEQQPFSQLWPKDVRRVDMVLDELITLRRRGAEKISNSVIQLETFKLYFRNPQQSIKKVRCPMDENAVLINWQGQVYLCGLLECIGNVREAELGNILNSHLAILRAAEMKACRKNCNNKINCFFKEDSLANEN